MQFKVLALSAFAVAASAQSSSTVVTTAVSSSAAAASASGSLNQLSVLSVLETALPSSLLAEAVTNSPAVISEVASEFSAGKTPTWFTALPSPIQTYLLHSPVANVSAALNSTQLFNSSSAVLTTTKKNGHTIVKTTRVGTHHTGGAGGVHTGKTTKGAAASSTPAGSSSSSGGAALPTAVMGAGLAGVVGIVGLFAL